MSITGSLIGYENNNEVIGTPRNNKKSSAASRSILNTSAGSMGKACPSLNSSNSVIITASADINHHNTKYPNSKRKNVRYMYQRQDHKNNLHLNSLWSIWYGVLFTLFQGYLAVHGAYRFLGCSLIQWKIEPVAELNLQIVLCGVVFILLPLFFTSAVFKVGNLANDSVKLALGFIEGRCSFSPQDGLEEEAKGGTLRALWTHGGPTSSFIHIVIAMCLLLPRLLLEARIIENGLLPREIIWQTELDFIAINRRNLVVLSIVTSPYQNISKNEKEFNETIYGGMSNTVVKNTKAGNFGSQVQNRIQKPTSILIELPDLNNSSEDSIHNHSILLEKGGIDNPDSGELLPTNLTDSNKWLNKAQLMPIRTPISRLTAQFSKPTNSTLMIHSMTTTITESDTTATPTTTAETHLPHSTELYRNDFKKSGNRHHKNRSNSYRRNQSNVSEETRIARSDEMDRNFIMKQASVVDFNKKNNDRGSYDELDTDRKSSTHTTKMTTVRDSHIHIVKPEKMQEIISATPLATNSKIIEIKTKSKKVKRQADELQVEIDPEYLIDDPTLEESSTLEELIPQKMVKLDGFSGMLQIFFGVEKEIDVSVFVHPPSAEFVNLVMALLVWSCRYPAVFWATTKPFATIFSLHMISSSLDIILSFIGISNLYKLQIFSEAMPVHNPGLILNGIVTLSLFLLSTVLVVASSMIMYLYGHGRLAAKMRDRSLITIKSTDAWIYFAHCASLCFVLALAVVKAPVINDLSATYKNNLHCPTFISALASVVHILLWIVVWLGLTAKRRWNFKLPPVETYAVIKGASQPLLMSSRIPNSATNLEQKGVISTACTADHVEDIYWPKLTPTSPKLKVTFNEVTSTSDDAHVIGEEQDGKRNSPRGAAVCFTSIAGEIDDGDYATLRSSTNTTGGGSGKILHLSEYDDLLPPPTLLLPPGKGEYLDDSTSEEGKLLACVRDDSVTYASARDLEPPQSPTPPPLILNAHSPIGIAPQALPEVMQLSSSPEHLVIPFSPATVTVHTNDTHIAASFTPRCLRRADSGVPNEALTPRSDTTSIAESTTSPPERAPSESSSGVHSGEERDEVVIRPRAVCKPSPKPTQPPIQEEPYGRSTNMRMSSFNNDTAGSSGSKSSSATLPLTRTIPEQKIDYSYCSTMPLPVAGHNHSSMQYKSQVYTPQPASKQTINMHSTIPNGIRCSNSHFLRRISHITKSESPYGHLGLGAGHHTFSKLLQDPLQNNLANTSIPEDRDSANYSMTSEQDCLYVTTNHMN